MTDRESREMTAPEVVAMLRRHASMTASLVVGIAVAALLIALLIPPRYTAVTAFVPEENGGNGALPSGIAGLAAQFGVSISAVASQSPHFYASIARSPVILDSLLVRPLNALSSELKGRGDTTVLAFVDQGGDTFPDSVERARQYLADAVSVQVDRQTDIVTLSVMLKDPAVAAAVANDLVARLQLFNATSRQSHARARRIFARAQLTKAESSLVAHENELQAFLEHNRGWDRAPRLTFEHDRLQRRAVAQQELTQALRRDLQAAQIEEVNDTPVLTTIYRASVPQEKSAPSFPLFIGAGLVVGIVASLLIVLVVEYRRQGGRIRNE